MIFLVRRLNNA